MTLCTPAFYAIHSRLMMLLLPLPFLSSSSSHLSIHLVSPTSPLRRLSIKLSFPLFLSSSLPLFLSSSSSSSPSASCLLGLRSSVICHLSAVICHLSSVICHLSSVICRLSSVVCRLSSVVCRLPSAVCRLPSVAYDNELA